MRILLFILLFALSLNASLHSKSAIIYYGKNISYPMVGIHDYIIVQPKIINTITHGFKRYKSQMYAYISIGEIDKNIDEYKFIEKKWIVAQNKAWNSDVLDLTNPAYINFLFDTMIEPQRKRGFRNFFFDTLDSYHLASENKKEIQKSETALVAFINEFHKRYPDSKLIVNRGFEIIDKIHDSLEAVLFESYYRGIGGKKLAYKKVSDSDREWLDIHIKKIKSYGLNIICVDYLAQKNFNIAGEVVKKIVAQGMIPYISNRNLNVYGISSKNAVKREILYLVDESIHDITQQGEIINSGSILEYMGYMQRFHDINKGLVDIEEMSHYAGVIIWLGNYYKKPVKLVKWVKKLSKYGIKVVFVNQFGMNPNSKLLKPLGIKITKAVKNKISILNYDRMMGYEMEPSFSISSLQIESKNAKPLLSFGFEDATESTPAAITTWGGYAIGDAFMITIDKDNIWVINPYIFLKEALRLKSLIVPDVTTQNGKRLLFTHVDGDGIMNRVEGDFGYYSGDVILNKILKVYKIPHSVSVIGAEISPNGLYPKISPELITIAKEMYSLENVEPATHTFTHPFFWGKIKNNQLDKKYRLKPKDYNFSLEAELSGTLKYINENLEPKHEAKTVFWSGDCMPRENAMEFINQNNILNINGGDTTITNTNPWLSGISPMGILRSNYIQVYTGQQNENVFTNNWLGPFWGFKRVVQTFKLTNSPRRFKPIDIYYHLYSGSKEASLSALTYVFDWAIKQDVMPIFTSEYIPKVMDYYIASMAKENGEWLVMGLKDLTTLRIEKENEGIDFNSSKSVFGIKHFEKHTYFALDVEKKHFIKFDNYQNDSNQSYLISANAKVVEYKRRAKHQIFKFKGYVALKLDFHLSKSCTLISNPKASIRVEKENVLEIELEYDKQKEAIIEIECSDETAN